MTKFYNFLKVNFPHKELSTAGFLLAFVLITLPLKNIYTSVATILFVGWGLFLDSRKFNLQKVDLWPLSYFVLMALSLLWTTDLPASVSGLQKQLSMFFVPFTFFFLRGFDKKTIYSIIRLYSFGMTAFGIFCLFQSGLRYLDTGHSSVFFHNDLVPDDPGAIYMSVFASLAFFYFIQVSSKSYLDQLCLTILTILIFLLSSKSIITIDFIIVVCYYAFFANIHSGTKTITIISVSIFLFLSLFYVKKVREKFLIEYETAFIDNTLNYELTKDSLNVYNVSINEAWNKDDFHKNSFLPGTALRVYQFRTFLDLLKENSIFFQGFGLEASQPYIKEKARQHNLDLVYEGYNFHNQYIQSFSELGIFGFLLLIGMLFLNLKNGFNNRDFLHIAFAITMIILFLSESFFCRQRGIVFFIVLYCLFNSVSKEKETTMSI